MTWPRCDKSGVGAGHARSLNLQHGILMYQTIHSPVLFSLCQTISHLSLSLPSLLDAYV